MRACVFCLSFLACSGAGAPYHSDSSPGIVFPTTLGEGTGDGAGDARAAQPSVPAETAPAEPAPAQGSLPDPEPLRLAEQWEYELRWDAGELSVVTTTPRTFPNPVVTARKMGRFAIELWIGPELVDRVRFDFPLLASEETGNEKTSALAAPPSLVKGAHVRQRVLVPNAPRARRAVLVDRATSKRIALPWPPNAPTSD